MVVNFLGASLYNKSTEPEATNNQNPNKIATCGIERLSQVSAQFNSNNSQSIHFEAKSWQQDAITECKSKLLKDPDTKLYPDQLNEWMNKFIQPKGNSPGAWARAIFSGIFIVKTTAGEMIFQGQSENANGPEKEKRLAEIEALLAPYVGSLPLGKEFPFDSLLLLPTSLLSVYYFLAFEKMPTIKPLSHLPTNQNHQVCMTVGESTNQIEFIKNSFIVDPKCRLTQILAFNYEKKDPSQAKVSLEFSYCFEKGIEKSKQQEAQTCLDNLALIFKALDFPSLVLK